MDMENMDLEDMKGCNSYQKKHNLMWPYLIHVICCLHLIMNIIDYKRDREATKKKKVKKLHNKCELRGEGGQQILVCEPQKSAFLELIFQKTCWN